MNRTISKDSGIIQTFWEEKIVPLVGENDFYNIVFD